VGKAHCGRTALCTGCPLAADLQFADGLFPGPAVLAGLRTLPASR
jgi:hypothetical protein